MSSTFRCSANYFSVIDLDKAKLNLYKGLYNKGITAKRCLKIIKANSFLDYKYVLPLIESTDIYLQKYSLSILISDKEYYMDDDIVIMEKIFQIVTNQFPDIGEKNEVNNTWRCKCGKINKIKMEYCKACSKDIKGFTGNEVKPSETLLSLKNKIVALKSIYNHKNS